MGQEFSPLRIAKEVGLRLDDLATILERLLEREYIIPSGKQLYMMTARGLDRLSSMPEGLSDLLGIDLSKKVEK